MKKRLNLRNNIRRCISLFVDIFNTDKKYNIIYADPPWTYPQSGGVKNSRGMAKQHYQTMTTLEICKLPIKSISTKTSMLFLWATFPNITEALHVMEAWGFEYKTAAFVWIKKTKKSNSNFVGMGAYTRANAEVCLLGVGKSVKANSQVVNHAVRQIIESPIREHSRKPDEARERILQLLGDLPRIELFARQEVDGWDCWGNEVGEVDETVSQ